MVLTSLPAQPRGDRYRFQHQGAWALIFVICQQREFEAQFTFSVSGPLPTWKNRIVRGPPSRTAGQTQ